MYIKMLNVFTISDIELEWEGIENVSVPEKKEVPINKEKTLLGYNKPIEDSCSTTETTASPEPPKNKQSPKRIPPVYDGSQLLVFGLFKDKIPKAVTIKAQSPDGPLSIRIEVPFYIIFTENFHYS